MAAMAAGKHVFVQKPLAHNIWQVRTLRKAAEKYGVKTVMGNQGHTWEGIRLVREWFEAGIIGEVREVHCWTDRPGLSKIGFLQPPPAGPAPVEPVPEGLDWELWQGPVAATDFSSQYLPGAWRGWWEYGCGGLGDIGCHCLDAPFGARATMPPVKLHWYEGGLLPEVLEGMPKGLPDNGMIMKGSRETLFSGGMRVQSPQLWPRERMKDYYDVLRRRPLPRSVAGNPFGELFAAIRGDVRSAGSSFEYACPLTEVVGVGVLAIRSGRSITWDAEKMQVKGEPTFDAWIKEPVREGWSYGEDMWRT